MCGVVGYYCENPTAEHKEILQRLFHFSKIRGLHAFGIAYESKYGLITNKFSNIRGIIRCLENLELPTMLIGHNRYSTSGDYKEQNNNQPLLKLGVGLVFNGIISQKDKKGMEEEFGKKLASYNDGEVVLNKILDGESEIEEFFQKHDCSFSGLRIKEGKLYAYTNGKRPLYCFEKDGGLFFCSTLDIMQRAVGEVNYFDLQPFYLYEAEECLKQI